MYKVLIVDDEPLVQVGVKSMLNWQELNMEVCATVSNGEQALQIIRKDMPDIVITDIKMPIMDGLTLLKCCREEFGFSKPLFVMLTSFEDFHMAKEAISYRAMDYLVKVELTPDKLKETLLRVKDTLERYSKTEERPDKKSRVSTNSYSYVEKYLICLLNNLFESEEQMLLQAEYLKVNISYGSYLCCYGSFESGIAAGNRDKMFTQFESSLNMVKELIGKYFVCQLLALDVSHFALIFCFDNKNEAINQEEKLEQILNILSRIKVSLQNYYNVNMRCGMGIICSSLMDLSESYQTARNSYQKTDKDNPICGMMNQDNSSHDVFNISLFKADLTKAFEELDSDLLIKTINDLCELLEAHTHHFVQALDAASNILYLSLSLLHDGETILNSVFAEYSDGYLSLYRQSNVSQVVGWLRSFAQGLGRLFDERRKDYKNKIVRDVKAYINEHIYEKLSLNEVAAHFAINPCYLSQLFGKYNDSGFSEYINYTKIQEAKRLLREEHRKVYEIAQLLSFGSEFYFSKVFKKVEGISPTEYADK